MALSTMSDGINATVIDDRGRRVPVPEALASQRERGEVNVPWQDRGLAQVSAPMLSGFGMFLLFLAGLNPIVAVVPLAFLLISHIRPTRHRVSAQALACAMVVFGKCGACARPFGGVMPDAAGLYTCTACGAAWHRDRVVSRRIHPSVSTIVGRLAANNLDGPGSALATDDRGIPIRAIFGPPLGLLARGWFWKQAARGLGASLASRRTWLFFAAMAAGVGLVFLMRSLRDGHEDEWVLWYVMAIGVVVALAYFVQGAIPAVRLRELLLEHGLCASCGASVVRHRPQFDGCVVCVSCHRAWRASRLGVGVVGDLEYPWRMELALPRRPSALVAPCPRCGYDMVRLAKCPECAYPDPERTPGATPHCARCGTTLPGENRACRKCGIMAGVVWRSAK